MVSKDKLLRELNDDESVMKDVKLVGADGGHVMASKFVLAIASPVFTKMFYGEFQEAKAGCDSVKMDYCTPVLRAVVRYCYIEEFNDNVDSDAYIAESLQLRSAADYLEMPELHKDITNALVNKGNSPEIKLATLRELMIRGETSGKIWTSLMDQIGSDPGEFFDCSNSTTPALNCSIALIESMFQNLMGRMPAYMAATFCLSWDETNSSATENDKLQLKKLADSIDLESMGVCKLARVSIMVPNNLFTQEHLYNAFVAVGNMTADCTKMHDISVSNAGTVEVNGLYKRDREDCDGGAGKYSRLGLFKGKRCKFRLFKSRGRWFISVVVPADGKESGTTSDGTFLFYKNLVREEYKNLPPLSGWMESSNGISPPPTITYTI